MLWRMRVLPALGGETIRQRCPGLQPYPGDQDIYFLTPHGANHVADLLDRFPLTKDDLLDPLSKFPVVVELGVGQVLKRHVLQQFEPGAAFAARAAPAALRRDRLAGSSAGLRLGHAARVRLRAVVAHRADTSATAAAAALLAWSLTLARAGRPALRLRSGDTCRRCGGSGFSHRAHAGLLGTGTAGTATTWSHAHRVILAPRPGSSRCRPLQDRAFNSLGPW